MHILLFNNVTFRNLLLPNFATMASKCIDTALERNTAYLELVIEVL
jgi:hypothetical protein